MGSKGLSLILNYSDDVKSICTAPVIIRFKGIIYNRYRANGSCKTRHESNSLVKALLLVTTNYRSAVITTCQPRENLREHRRHFVYANSEHNNHLWSSGLWYRVGLQVERPTKILKVDAATTFCVEVRNMPKNQTTTTQNKDGDFHQA